MIDTKRRTLLKGSLTAGAFGAAMGAGLLTPGSLLAAWNAGAFSAKDPAAALKELLGTDLHEPSDALRIRAPEIAENAAKVRVTVETEIEGVKTITIVAPGNQAPLIATFELGDKADAFVVAEIKMAQTGDVVAIAQTDDALYSAAKPVQVSEAGC